MSRVDERTTNLTRLNTASQNARRPVSSESKDHFTCISLFSGAMGLDIGIERTGCFEILAAVEFDPVFCDTIRKNRDAGRVQNKDMLLIDQDITELDPRALLEQCGLKPGELDLLVAGPPCQAFSSAGRRRSVSDPRGTMLWEFLRFIEVMRPRAFVMENVRGLTSAALRHRPIRDRPQRGGPPLEPEEEPGSVLKLWSQDLQLQTRGKYRVDCFEVNAVNHGAPQLRERAIFIGNRDGAILDWPQPSHGPGLWPHSTLGDAIGHLYEPDPILLDFSARKKHYLAQVPPGGNWRSLPEATQKESMGRAWYAKGGRSGWWRRLSWDLPCPTIVTMPNHASTSMCHPEEIRVLSLRECAAVQGFPDDWEFIGTPQQQYQQVGNAVPTLLGEIAGGLVSGHLKRVESGEDVRINGADGFRKIYMYSQVRTRQWFKDGRVFTWTDGQDNSHAHYSATRANGDEE